MCAAGGSETAAYRDQGDKRNKTRRDAHEKIPAKDKIDDERDRAGDQTIGQRRGRERAGGQEQDAHRQSGDQGIGNAAGPDEKLTVHAHPARDQHTQAAPKVGSKGAPQDEQREFKSFLDKLRFAKDKAEFDQFMADRRNNPPAPPPATPPSA